MNTKKSLDLAIEITNLKEKKKILTDEIKQKRKELYNISLLIEKQTNTLLDTLQK